MHDIIRGDVVKLILDVDGDTLHFDPAVTQENVRTVLYRAHLAARHKDGSPVTTDEAVLAATATRAEIDYMLMLAGLYRDACDAERADYKRIAALTEPWPDLTIRELLPRLPADVQAEMEILVDRVSDPNGHMDPTGDSTVHYDAYRRALAELG